MDGYVYSFEKLLVWQDARKFVSFVYAATKKFPKEELYGLTNQIRRASVSVPANIAEGSSRSSAKDQAYFSQLSYSSLMETLNHLYIAFDLGYLPPETLNTAKNHVHKLSNMLNGLRKNQILRHQQFSKSKSNKQIKQTSTNN
jgi:four helix bundle protein